MSKILSVDFGKKRVGIAISDPDQIVANKLPLLEVKDTEHAIKKLLETIQKYDATTLLFGLPLNADGEETQMSSEIRNVAEKIREQFDGEIIFRNEFYSSAYTHDMTEEHKFVRKQFDSEVARMMLQNYLDEKM